MTMNPSNCFRLPIRRARQRGFSLLEVLIAVVVLSTGLLALAALQGSLARASADAKVRSQVAALLQARMDELRSTGYFGAAAATDSCALNEGNTDGSNWVPQSFCTLNAVGALEIDQQVDTWTSAVGGPAFAVGAPADPDDPQFKRVRLEAEWTDVTGATRRLAMVSDLSELSLKDGLIVPPDDSSLDALSPVVRQDSPVTAGVIPIALGNGQASAASNPTPELVGKNQNQEIVGTRFNVLTYVPETGNSAIIQRRFENEIIKCSCQYGAGGSNLPEIFRTAQWPAVWTGERYDLYRLASVNPAPGQTLSSGPASGVTQSPLCQECCRDHHDTTTTGVAKFDPERTATPDESTGYEKYNLNNQNA
jgi:type IV pilus modification protein PilV